MNLPIVVVGVALLMTGLAFTASPAVANSNQPASEHSAATAPAAKPSVNKPPTTKSSDEDTYRNIVKVMTENIAARYPIKSLALETSAALRDMAQHGTAYADDNSFIKAVNDVLWETAHDLHLKLHSEKTIADRTSKGGGKRVPKMRRISAPQGADGNETFAPLGTTRITGKMLNKNTGLITITSPIYANKALFTQTLSKLSSADNIIIDARNVRGGTGRGVNYFTSQFFDEPTHLSSSITREFEKPQELWTVETPMSEIFGSKDIYVLTGQGTASGAEALVYALKNTQRGTLIGQKTRGAGNAGAFLPLGSGMLLFLPIAQTISPRTGEAWERVGIEPHINAALGDALNTALRVIGEKSKIASH